MTVHHSDKKFLSLAADALKSLSVGGYSYDEAKRMQGIARLSALSRLEVVQLDTRSFYNAEHASFNVDLEPLLRLPLVELVTIRSRKMMHSLVQPCTFSTLQRLHIEESTALMRDYRPLQQQQQHNEQLELEKTRHAIFRLPSLKEISGASSIFEAAQDHQLQQWQQMQAIEPLMTKYSITKTDALSCWRRL